ncbi:MAG: H-NS family nucleoid-associated regulatory protein [Janthinobacterium lividum]
MALLAQQESLARRIEDVRTRERENVLQEVRQKIAAFEIVPSEIGFGGRGRPVKRVRAAVAPKFRDPDTGSTWSGRGKPPRWIAGKDRTEFEI